MHEKRRLRQRKRERRQTGRGEYISAQKSLNNAAILQMEQKAKERRQAVYTAGSAATEQAARQAAVHAACSRHTHKRALKPTIEVASRAHTDVWLDATAHRSVDGNESKGERVECSCLS